MSIHIRAKTSGIPGLRVGEDAVVDGAFAKAMQAGGLAWVTGGDAGDFAMHGIEPDTDVGPPIAYAAPDTIASVAAGKEV